MSIADHVAILLHSSLDQPRVNKINKNKVEFYANVAFPPTAANDLAEAMKEVAPNNSLNGQRLTIEANGKKAKPHAGIPADWLILRLSSGPDFSPDLFGTNGQKIPALPLHSGEIRTEFFSGQRIRVNGYPFHWKHAESGAQGVSWNLSGVMAEGGGERRAGGGGEPSENAFAKYRADAPVQQTVTQTQPSVQNTSTADSAANPFQANTAANPFG